MSEKLLGKLQEMSKRCLANLQEMSGNIPNVFAMSLLCFSMFCLCFCYVLLWFLCLFIMFVQAEKLRSFEDAVWSCGVLEFEDMHLERNVGDKLPRET